MDLTVRERGSILSDRQHRQRPRDTKKPNAQLCAGTNKTSGRAGWGVGTEDYDETRETEIRAFQGQAGELGLSFLEN